MIIDSYLDYLDKLFLYSNDDCMFKTYATRSGEKLSTFNCHRQFALSLKTYQKFYEKIEKSYSATIRTRSEDRIRNAVKDRNERYEKLFKEYEDTHHYDNMHRSEITDMIAASEDSSSNCDLEKLRALYGSNSRVSRRPQVSSRGSIRYDGANDLFVMTGDFNDYTIMNDRSLKEVMEEDNDEGNNI